MITDGKQTIVRLGELAVGGPMDTLAALGLGSCVAVVLHDAQARVGTLAHVMLPSQSLSRVNTPGRAADSAIPTMLEEMRECGAAAERCTARLVGGASMFADLLAPGAVHIGERNIAACRLTLRKAGIPVVGEAVGGQTSRSVWFDVGEGTVRVRSLGGDPDLL